MNGLESKSVIKRSIDNFGRGKNAAKKFLRTENFFEAVQDIEGLNQRRHKDGRPDWFAAWAFYSYLFKQARSHQVSWVLSLYESYPPNCHKIYTYFLMELKVRMLNKYNMYRDSKSTYQEMALIKIQESR